MIRFLAGAWCLTGFVLITAYSSVLISFLTAPDPLKPIINSVNDLPKKPNIHFMVNKGWIADLIFQVSTIITRIRLLHKSPALYFFNLAHSNCETKCKMYCMQIERYKSGFWNSQVFGRGIET